MTGGSHGEVAQDTQRERRIFQLHMCEVTAAPEGEGGTCPPACLSCTSQGPGTGSARALVRWPLGCHQASVMAKRGTAGPCPKDSASAHVAHLPLPAPQYLLKAGESQMKQGPDFLQSLIKFFHAQHK